MALYDSSASVRQQLHDMHQDMAFFRDQLARQACVDIEVWAFIKTHREKLADVEKTLKEVQDEQVKLASRVSDLNLDYMKLRVRTMLNMRKIEVRLQRLELMETRLNMLDIQFNRILQLAADLSHRHEISWLVKRL